MSAPYRGSSELAPPPPPRLFHVRWGSEARVVKARDAEDAALVVARGLRVYGDFFVSELGPEQRLSVEQVDYASVKK